MAKIQKIPVDQIYQTPKEICDYIVSMIPDFAHSILEPTPGKGNLVASLIEKNKYSVTAADDFFKINKKLKYDCIVMNPPFSSNSAYLENAPKDIDLKGMKVGYHILEECMKMSDNIIALMPWFTISDSDVRFRNLRNFGIKSVTPLPRKTFNYARIQTVILQLQRGYQGNTNFYTNLI